MTVNLIGIGEDDTTFQGWEDGLDKLDQYEGQGKAEAFAAVLFDGVAYTVTNYPRLTSVVGSEHDGRAHEVSGAGNTRIESSNDEHLVDLNDDWVRLDWMETRGPIGQAETSIAFNNSAVDTIQYVHHCLVHCNNAGLMASQYGIETTANADGICNAYRNIVYGTGGRGMLTRAATIGAVLFNTVYEAQRLTGILAQGASVNVANNAVFDCDTDDFDIQAGGYNCSSDATAGTIGANNIINKVAANNFVNPTTTWANTDLLIKDNSADIFETGDNTYSSVTYPEIGVPVENRGVTIPGAFNIGASQDVDAPTTTSTTSTTSTSSTSTSTTTIIDTTRRRGKNSLGLGLRTRYRQ